MRLTTLDEASIQAIGHAFGYYDYGKETGMGAACSSPDKTALYICGFVRALPDCSTPPVSAAKRSLPIACRAKG